MTNSTRYTPAKREALRQERRAAIIAKRQAMSDAEILEGMDVVGDDVVLVRYRPEGREEFTVPVAEFLPQYRAGERCLNI